MVSLSPPPDSHYAVTAFITAKFIIIAPVSAVPDATLLLMTVISNEPAATAVVIVFAVFSP